LAFAWEGTLIYQHLYNAGATHYDLSDPSGYDDLYLRLTDQPKVQRPKLGERRRALPQRPVKTNPAMFLSMPIDVNLWNAARWSATFFSYQPGKPPILGLAFLNEAPARRIFEGWRERYGDNDRYEELRISIVEGKVPGEADGYTVHVGPDPEAAIQRFKAAGYAFDSDVLMCISRLNRMNPPPGSTNLATFKALYSEYKTYYLAPGVVPKDGKQLKPIFELGIFKGKVLFRQVSDISENDLDSIVLGSGKVQRAPTPFPRQP
jgi:hypothetical protein